MSEFGTIEWQRYDADDEATHPDTGKELIIIALKGGKPVFIPRGYFGLGIDFVGALKDYRSIRIQMEKEKEE